MTSNISFPSLTACLDMAGCPNRCRHCWLGVTPNGRLREEDLHFVAGAFRPFTDKLTVDSWYREPDYLPEYKRLWEVEQELSDSHVMPHWELMSVWRAVRDPEYVPWLKSLGLKACQLTLFGGWEKTDYYTGRRGAYDEIIGAIEQLLNAEIAPRIQVFVNQDNIADLGAVMDLIHEMRLEERCAAFGTPFSAFVHQGSCDGENAKLYDIRVTPRDLERVPPLLQEYSLRHWNKDNFADIFGKTERELCAELADSREIVRTVSDTPVFFVDKDFNVYPNVTTPTKYWLLGNLKTDGAESILRRYVNDESPAQHIRVTVTLGELVKSCGDPESERLFVKSDYIDPLVRMYCERSEK
jgi:MoaA/NifB/PqqE/SkfB family radical SAM enzyme